MKNWVFIALLIPILAGYAVSKQQVDRRVVERQKNLDIRYLPSPETARLLAFGYKQALADMYWIEAINYYGDQLLNKKRDYQYLYPYLELILHLDPYFTTFYDWAATAFIYNGLPISRTNLLHAIEFANRGIQTLHEVGRHDASLIRKGAFNFALEAQIPEPSVPYFAMAGRSFSSERDLLLVGASYASFAADPDTSSKLKEEYLAYKMYEVESPAAIQESLVILSSPAFNSQAADFVRSLRVQVESDDEVKKLVEKRLEANPLLERAVLEENEFKVSDKIDRLLTVDISKNWMTPALHLLLDL